MCPIGTVSDKKMVQSHRIRTFADTEYRQLPLGYLLKEGTQGQGHNLKPYSQMAKSDAQDGRPHYSDSTYVEAFKNNDECILDAFQHEARKAFSKMMMRAQYRRIDLYTKNNIFTESLTDIWEKAYRDELVSEDGIVKLGREGHRAPLTLSLVPYFLGIVRNKILTEWTKGKGITHVDDLSPFGEDIEPEVEADEPDDWKEVVWVCVNQMPKRCQELMDLFFVQGLSDQAVLQLRSQQHGEQMSSKGLKSAKSKCLQSLRKQVKDLCKQRGIHITTALEKS